MGKRQQVDITEILARQGISVPAPQPAQPVVRRQDIAKTIFQQHYNRPGSLHFEVFMVPPSSNALYFTDWRRKRSHVLSEEGLQFQRRFIEMLHTRLPEITRFISNDLGAVYSVQYVIYFELDDIVCKSFGAGTKKAAVERYKQLDAENRCKIVADSLAKAIGLDDRYFFSTCIQKKSADLVGGVPQTHIDIWRSDPAFFGV